MGHWVLHWPRGWRHVVVRRWIALGDARSRVHQGAANFQECVLPAKHKKLYVVQSPPTWSSIPFHNSVEGVTTPTHASGGVVSIILQRLLSWLCDGDPVVVGKLATGFVCNTDASKLDECYVVMVSFALSFPRGSCCLWSEPGCSGTIPQASAMTYRAALVAPPPSP